MDDDDDTDDDDDDDDGVTIPMCGPYFARDTITCYVRKGQYLESSYSKLLSCIQYRLFEIAAFKFKFWDTINIENIAFLGTVYVAQLEVFFVSDYL